MTNTQPWTRARERLLLLTLAAIQFTTIIDFLIIIPLGPQYKRIFNINEGQFGSIVAAYGIAAGLSGLAAGFFLDRFDRKKAMIWIYLGFVIGTWLCAVSPTYHLLVAARFFAGAFGGVVGAIVLAIVGDVIPHERRGAAMGMVMSSFSLASIVGVPLGLEVATRYNWHVPFHALALLSAVILGLVALITPPLRAHLQHARDVHPVVRTWRIMTHPDHLKAYVFMAALTCGGFCVFPFLATYMEANVGLAEGQLKWIYLCGGGCTLFTMNWVGRWADRAGKPRVFAITSIAAAVPILLFTNLGRVPLVLSLATSTLLMICMSGRMVPAMAMMTAAVEPRDRGGFMSINTAVQQISMGVTSLLAGLIIGEGPHKEMTRFPINGLLAIACTWSCIYLAKFLKAPTGKEKAGEPMMMEG